MIDTLNAENRAKTAATESAQQIGLVADDAGRGAGSQSDVRLDLASGRLYAIRQACYLEYRLFVTTGRHDIGMRLMLNSLDGRTLRPDDQTHHSVGHSYLDRHVTGHGRGWPGWRAEQGAQRALARSAYLRKMLRGGENLALRTGHVLLASCDDEYGFFAAHRRLDVGIRLRSKCFDLTTCNQREKYSLRMLLRAISI